MAVDKDLLRARMWKGELIIRDPELVVITRAVESLNNAVSYLSNITTGKYNWEVGKLPKKERSAKLAQFLRADFAGASTELESAIRHLHISIQDADKIKTLELKVKKKIRNHALRLNNHDKVLDSLVQQLAVLQKAFEDMAKKESFVKPLLDAASIHKATLLNLIDNLGRHKAKMVSVYYLFSREVKGKKSLKFW